MIVVIGNFLKSMYSMGKSYHTILFLSIEKNKNLHSFMIFPQDDLTNGAECDIILMIEFDETV